MKYLPLKLSLAAAYTAFASVATADTTYVSGNIDLVGSWNNGLPSLANPGTINVSGANGANRNVTNFVVNQTSGTIGTTFGGVAKTGGSWEVSGGTHSANVLTQGTSSLVTVSGGNYTATGTGDIVVNSSSSLIMTSGGMTAGDDLLMNSSTVNISGGTANITDRVNFAADSSFTISGGALNAVSFGAFLNNTGDAFFNGGITTISGVIGFGTAAPGGVVFTMGGSVAGSLSAANFDGNAANRRNDWLTGSLMTFTISSASSFWAETEWDANRLFFNGNSKSALSNLTWANAINPSIGLDGVGGSYWNYDSTSKTLALGYSAVPEPTGALAGLLLGLGLLRRRRKG